MLGMESWFWIKPSHAPSALSKFIPTAHEISQILMKVFNRKSRAGLEKNCPDLKDVAERGNRPEATSTSRKVEEKMAELDDDARREIFLTEPLLELHGERNLTTSLEVLSRAPVIVSRR